MRQNQLHSVCLFCQEGSVSMSRRFRSSIHLKASCLVYGEHFDMDAQNFAAFLRNLAVMILVESKIYYLESYLCSTSGDKRSFPQKLEDLCGLRLKSVRPAIRLEAKEYSLFSLVFSQLLFE